jgi:DNA-binding transcriptional ArsR family regulator
MKRVTGTYEKTTTAGEEVRVTADETTATVRDLFALVSSDRAAALAHPATTVTAARLFEELPQHPMVTVAGVTEFLGATKPTVGKAINALVDAGILVETTGRRRDRVFSYAAYLDLLREDTELDAALDAGTRSGSIGTDRSDPGSAIHLAAMTHTNDRDQEVATLVRIDDSVWADSKTAEALPFGTHDRSLLGIVAEAFDRGHNALALALF